jgi:ABC-2 type transport system permease protein
MLARQTQVGLVGLWRTPSFSATSLLLPVIFFAFFGLPHAHETVRGVEIGAFLLASFGAYAVGSMMVFTFGVAVASERAANMDRLYRATPLPPLVYLGAKLLAALIFALLALLVLFAFGALAGGIRLPPAVWVGLAGRLLAGAVPLIALGIAIGYAVDPTGAGGVANLIYLPLSFGSGLFVPVESLPDVVQRVAPYLPTYHYGQLAWGAVGAATEPLGATVLWLAGYSVALFAIAARSYRREESRRFR